MKKEISEKKMRAIYAMLESATLEEAAKKAQISPRTLQRWNADPEFKKELLATQSDLFASSGKKLIASMDDAVNALQDVLTNPSQPGAANKYHAASKLIDLGTKYYELSNTEERISRLEKKADYEI